MNKWVPWRCVSYVITLGDEDGMKKNKIVSPAGIGMNINENKRKKELMLHFAGPAVNEIFDTLEDTEEERGYRRRKRIPKKKEDTEEESD